MVNVFAKLAIVVNAIDYVGKHKCPDPIKKG